MKKAADDISAGMKHLAGEINSFMPLKHILLPFVFMAALNAQSIRSVWSRVLTGSITQVEPFAYSPASNIALFTWADATGNL
jgi:hypothetical protein